MLYFSENQIYTYIFRKEVILEKGPDEIDKHVKQDKFDKFELS